MRSWERPAVRRRHWHFPDTALCSALAEVLTWATDGTTAAAAATEGWPFADVIAVMAALHPLGVKPNTWLSSGTRRH